MLERAKSNKKIRFVTNARVKKWTAGSDGLLSGFEYENMKTGKIEQVIILTIGLLFVANDNC